MALEANGVIGGVDTHKHTRRVAVIGSSGRFLGGREFGADTSSEAELLAWLRSHGPVAAVGVEGTGSYGGSLARRLAAAGVRVVEVNRPDRAARRSDGKSDRLDAEQPARSVLSATATAVPKSRSGPVEAIRALRVTRSSAVKARAQAFLTMHSLVVGCSGELRDELITLTKRALVKRCAALEPDAADLLDLIGQPDRLQLAASKQALGDLARRWLDLDAEVKALDKTQEHREIPPHRPTGALYRMLDGFAIINSSHQDPTQT